MKRLLASSLLILIFIIPCNAQETYKLEYKFEEGKTYFYRDISSNDVVQEMMGKEMKINSDVKGKMKLIAESEQDGLYSIIMSMDSMEIHTNMPKDTTIYLDQMLNKKVRVHVNSTGKIQKTEMIDSVDLNEFSMGIGSGTVQLIEMPEKEIAIGENWTNIKKDSISAMGGTLNVTKEFAFNLAGKEDVLGYSCLKIPFTSKITMEGTGNMQGFEFFMEGTGSSSGTLYLEPEKGLMIKMEENIDNDITMAATGQQNLVIPITQSTKLVRELVSE